MPKCQHEPMAMYADPMHAAAALLRPHRADDWRRCQKCGMVGLASRRTRRIHSWLDRQDLVESARKWNVWNSKLAADDAA